jgi:hypothetical protein
MKIRIFMALILAIVTARLFPQTFHGGIMAGITASQVDGDSYAGFNKVGLQGGVYVNTMLVGRLGARMEIKYAARGARKPVSSDDTQVYQLTLHYIDLPVMLHYDIYRITRLELGIVPGYLFDKQGKDNGGRLPESFLVAFRKFDLGSLIGISLILSDRFSLNLRYSYSLLSIRDPDKAGGFYGWFGRILGLNSGDYNNYLSFGLYCRLK